MAYLWYYCFFISIFNGLVIIIQTFLHTLVIKVHLPFTSLIQTCGVAKLHVCIPYLITVIANLLININFSFSHFLRSSPTRTYYSIIGIYPICKDFTMIKLCIIQSVWKTSNLLKSWKESGFTAQPGIQGTKIILDIARYSWWTNGWMGSFLVIN